MSTTPRGFGAPPPHTTPSLVGRDRELATVRAHLAAALAGRGSLVLIGGEAGIGKTALADAILAEAYGQGTLMLVGCCYDLAETPPHRPWAEALVARPPGYPHPVANAGAGRRGPTCPRGRNASW